MNRTKSWLIVLIGLTLLNSCSERDTTSPNVIDTFPPAGSSDVDPDLTEISVTFSEPMTDGNWSWAFTQKDKFPEMNGQPYYRPGLTTNVLPVKLEPNKEYEIWINSEKHKNFKDQSGNPAVPFRFVFKTK